MLAHPLDDLTGDRAPAVVVAVTVAAGLAATAVAIQPGGLRHGPATGIAVSYDDPVPDVTADPADPLVHGISGRLGPAWTTFTGTLRGFPPLSHDPGALQPLIGATVTVACGLPPTRSQEVLMGLRATGPDGGGWRGEVLSYTTADGQAHHLVLPTESLMCGRSNEPCGVPED